VPSPHDHGPAIAAIGEHAWVPIEYARAVFTPR
jgi:hypothetical protein